MVREYFAEFDTDKIIREKYFKDFDYKGILVEVGGGTPEYLSMSKHFKLNGWRCVIIEPNPKFANMHREIGNEIYEYACSDNNIDDIEFHIAHVHNHGTITNDDHSFSSIRIKDSYLNKYGIDKLPVTVVNVNVRTLDYILNEANVNSIDILSIDVEGWELEVMGGFDSNKFNPKVVLLENVLHDENYISYMGDIGYKLDEKLNYNYIFIKQN